MNEIVKQEAIELLNRIEPQVLLKEADSGCKKMVVARIIDIISAPYCTEFRVESDSSVLGFLRLKKLHVMLMDDKELSQFCENCVTGNDVLVRIYEFLLDLRSRRYATTNGSRNYYLSEIRSFSWATGRQRW